MVNFTWENFGAKNFIELYKPEYIDHVAANFPNLVMVLSHAGCPYIIEHLAIANRCGPNTPAGAIAFSLPISAVAGLRVLED